jgi:hypothetical protein
MNRILKKTGIIAYTLLRVAQKAKEGIDPGVSKAERIERLEKDNQLTFWLFCLLIGLNLLQLVMVTWIYLAIK